MHYNKVSGVGSHESASSNLTRLGAIAVDENVDRMSPADLLRLGSARTIRLSLGSYAGLSPGFSFRAITCRYGATRPPSLSEISALPADIDVVLYPACPLEAELPRVSLGRHVFRFVRCRTNFIVGLQGTFDEYWNQFSGKTRWSIKRKAQKLAQAYGQIQYRQYRSSQELAEFYCAAKQVKLGEYQERVLRNAIPEDDSLYRQMQQVASRNEARGYLMSVNSKPIAYLYCVACDNAILHELSGYDSEFARCSPGVLLQLHALQQLFAEQTFSVFDFEGGGGQHKSFFSTACSECADVYFFQRTPRALASVGFILGVSFGVDRSRAVIRRLHLESGARRAARWAMTQWAA